jgi:hypothetical protein
MGVLAADFLHFEIFLTFVRCEGHCSLLEIEENFIELYYTNFSSLGCPEADG